MTNAILIARVSHTDSSQSPEGQLNDLREYAHSRKFTVLHEYASQESVQGGRRDYAPIMELLDEYPDADTLVCTEVCRISRNLLDLLLFCEKIHKRGVALCVIAMSGPTLRDKEVDSSVMFALQVIGAAAEHDNAVRSRRIKTGRKLGSTALKRKKYCRHLTKEECIELYTMYKRGYIDEIKTIKATMDNLGARFGLTRSTVSKFCVDVKKSTIISRYFDRVDKFNAKQEELSQKSK